MAKLQAQQMMTQAKVQNSRESHADKTAQRRVQFEQEQGMRAETHRMDMQEKAAEIELDLAAKEAKLQQQKEATKKNGSSSTTE